MSHPIVGGPWDQVRAALHRCDEVKLGQNRNCPDVIHYPNNQATCLHLFSEARPGFD